jgi:hypothetical protein
MALHAELKKVKPDPDWYSDPRNEDSFLSQSNLTAS